MADEQFDMVRRLAESINGWLSPNEMEFLYQAAKQCQGKGLIVEIGSWKGKSTVLLAKGSQAGQKIRVVAIDPHIDSSDHQRHSADSTLDDFRRNIQIAGVEEIVEPRVALSEEVVRIWHEPIEFLWIDGDHSYAGVKLDSKLWEPFLIEGALIAFHDTDRSDLGPKQVVAEDLYHGRKFRQVGFIDSITYGRKTSHLSIADVIRNQLIYALRLAYLALKRLALDPQVRRLGKDLLKQVVSRG